MPIPSRGYDSIEVVKIILVPLSFPLVRFVRTLKLLDILGKVFKHTMLDLILCNANKVLGFLKISTTILLFLPKVSRKKISYLDCIIDLSTTFITNYFVFRPHTKFLSHS